MLNEKELKKIITDSIAIPSADTIARDLLMKAIRAAYRRGRDDLEKEILKKLQEIESDK